MLDRIVIRRFKRFEEVEIELGESVVLIGPNNSGKTSVLQALALWDLGVRRWLEKRGTGPVPRDRSGVTISRADLVSLPLPEVKLMWKDLHVREGVKENGKSKTRNIRIEIEVAGTTAGEEWSCGLEFDYGTSESIYCRPLGWAGGKTTERAPIPEAAAAVRVAYLPPMSGLAASEFRLDPGAVQVRLGEGRTAEVLRNLCFALREDTQHGEERWGELVDRVRELFGVELLEPVYVKERGELTMSYRELGARTVFDISASGRGLQQITLLMAYLLLNPGAVLLLDEPDAHLEILRQKQVYTMLTEVASRSGSQMIAGSHSEVILNEAAGRDVVVALVGTPHRIDRNVSQVYKALARIGYQDYYQAETTGWVLYLEGSTDLAILREFASILDHPAREALERPFTHYVGNQPKAAEDHFFALKEAKPDLVGLVILDRLDKEPPPNPHLPLLTWARREIENYLCFPEVLEAYAASLARESVPGPLFEEPESERYVGVMRRCIEGRVPPAALENADDPFWTNTKATDDYLDLVFDEFFGRLGIPNRMRKGGYHRLARFVPRERIDPEIVAKLDRIVEVAGRANPASGASDA